MLVQQFSRFLIVGSVGFLVDAVFLYVFSIFINIYLARVFSFSIAVYVTWRLNSGFTFSTNGKGILSYLGAQSIGLGINYGGFSALVYFFGTSADVVFFSLVCATAVSTFVNFLVMRYWVFSAQ